MNHFPDETWVDLARGTLARADEDPLREHLSGCADCRARHSIWLDVNALGTREAQYEPPASALEAAESLFAASRPERVSAAVRIAELVFDSARSPAPAGVRSLSFARHLTYKASEYYVDLRVEEQGTPGPSSVVGQVMRSPSDREAPPLEGLPVTLARGTVAISTTLTNRLGEFQLEVDTRKDHRLAIEIGGDVSFVVPLRARRGPSGSG